MEKPISEYKIINGEYTVQKGDRFPDMMKAAYGAHWLYKIPDFLKLNKISSATLIYPGKKVKFPDLI